MEMESCDSEDESEGPPPLISRAECDDSSESLGDSEINDASLYQESWYSSATLTTETMTNLDNLTVESEYYDASDEESEEETEWEHERDVLVLERKYRMLNCIEAERMGCVGIDPHNFLRCQ